MANPEHVRILKQGTMVWNAWRAANHQVKPDLTEAHLKGLDLNRAYLRDAILIEANLSNTNLNTASLRWADLTNARVHGADLSGASLNYAILRKSDFTGTNFMGAELVSVDFQSSNLAETNFCEADLIKVNLHEAVLRKASFTATRFRETDFSESELDETIFGLTGLTDCKGFDTVKVKGRCSIDFQTLRASRNLPKSFLLKIGLPENYINYLPDFFDENPIRMYPVFLSHSWQNKDFASKLYEALIARGVQVWYDEKKMKPGDDIYESLSRGIEVYDKMILVCSQPSLSESWWVDREIDRILAKERQLQKERGKRINLLIPIRIDDHIFEWDGAKGEEVRRYIIGDFRYWQDEAKFQKALDELIAALNVDRGEDAPLSFL